MLKSGGVAANQQFIFDSTTLSLGGAADSDAVTVPDAHLLFHADFQRSGSDLKLVGQDGQTFLVSDYFKNEKRPTLLSPDGASLTPNVVEALAGPLAPGQYAQAGAPQAAAQAIGRVAKAEGNATVVRNGVAITLNVGDAILKGDVAQTGTNSALSLVFTDGTTFSLTSNARMVLNEFVYSPGGTNNSALINLVQGSITFLAGQVAKTGDMKVETPVATMGIRGTLVQTVVDLNLGTVRMTVMVERDGTTGAFTIINKVTGAIIGTVNQAGVGWVVQPAGPLQVLAQQFQLTNAELQQAFQAMQAIFNDQQTGQQLLQQNPLDQNTPNTKTNGTNGSSEVLPGPQTTFVVGGGENGVPPTTTTVTTQGNTPPDPPGNPNPGDPPPPTPGTTIVANVAPVAHDDVNTVEQNAPPTVTGNVLENDTDENVGDTKTVTVVTAVSTALHGTLVLGADGKYTYTLNQAGHALAVGETIQDVYTYTVTDSGGLTSTAKLTITVHGTNDAPVATADINDVTEAGAGTLGDPFATGNVLSNDTDVDHNATKTVVGVAKGTPDGSVSGGVNSIVTGTFGFLVLLANGSYLYTLNNFDPDTQKLAAGETGIETFTYTMRDEHGATSTTTLTLTVHGTNDGPTITGGASSGTVTENGLDANEHARGTPSVSGALNKTDIDSNDNSSNDAWSAVARSGQTQTDADTVKGTYGSLSVDQDGHWIYTLDDALATTQALSLGQTKTERFTVQVKDQNGASDTQTITVTVKGSNDAPVITGGTDTGEVIEDGYSNTGTARGTPSVTGTLTKTDADSDATTSNDNWSVVAQDGQWQNTSNSVLGLYGTLSVDADGQWTYTIDEGMAQALSFNETKTEIFTVQVADNHGATDTHTVTITVKGSNDAPTIEILTPDPGPISAPAGNPDQAITFSNNFTFSDVDIADTHTVTWAYNSVDSTLGEGFGTFTASKINDSHGDGGLGSWEFDVDPEDVNALPAGQHLAVYDVTVSDTHGGRATHQVTITINGPTAPADVNDAPSLIFSEQSFLNFDGGSQKAVAENAAIAFGDTNLTFEAWIRWDGSGNSDILQGIFYNGSSTDGFGVVGVVGDEGLQLKLLANGVGVWNSGRFLDSGSWHQLAMTTWGDTYNLFIDGESWGSWNPRLIPASGPFTIGGTTNNGNAEGFHGSIGEARLWDVVRTPEEMDAKRFVGLAGNEANLVDYWPLNDGASNTAVDRVGQDHNLTLAGDPQWVTQDGSGWPVRNGNVFLQEDHSVTIHGISVNDVDAEGGLMDVVLSVGHGNLTRAHETLGVTVTGAGTGELHLSGVLAAINTALHDGIVYTPDDNFNGHDPLTVTVNDNGNTGDGGPKSDSMSVEIVVRSVNDGPTALDDSYSAPDGDGRLSEDSETQIPVSALLLNDTTTENGETLSVIGVSATSAQGAAVSLVDGNVIYNPAGAASLQGLTAGQEATDTFTYTLSDGNGGTDTATVSVLVAGANEDDGTLHSGIPVTGAVSTNGNTGSTNPAFSDYWQFQANAGDHIHLEGHRDEFAFDMAFWVFQGAKQPADFGDSIDGNDAGFIAFGDDQISHPGPYGDPLVDFTAGQTGAYTVVVVNYFSGADDGDGHFPYHLQMTQTPPIVG